MRGDLVHPDDGVKKMSAHSKKQDLVLATCKDPTLSSKDQWSHDQSVVDTYSQGDSPLMDNV